MWGFAYILAVILIAATVIGLAGCAPFRPPSESQMWYGVKKVYEKDQAKP